MVDKKSKVAAHGKHALEGKQSDIKALGEHVKENPVMYIVFAVFLLLCVVVGSMYRVNSQTKERDVATLYMKAMENTDPGLRAAELEPLTETKSAVTADALYMMGEAAFESNDLEKAAKAFERLRSEYPDFEYTPDAVEGLGFVAEEQKNYESAITTYQEVMDLWPDSFAARRQDLNIARCQEQLGDSKAAIDSYRTQMEIFPGSHVANEAKLALNDLRKSNPELFPEPEVVAVPETPEQEDAADDKDTLGFVPEISEETVITIPVEDAAATEADAVE